MESRSKITNTQSNEFVAKVLGVTSVLYTIWRALGHMTCQFRDAEDIFHFEFETKHKKDYTEMACLEYTTQIFNSMTKIVDIVCH
jgi:hypothetical protein